MLVLHRSVGERVGLFAGDSLAWLELVDAGRREAKIRVETDGRTDETWVKVNEAFGVRIGETDTTVTLTDVHRGSVRLGFDAPESVKIWRKELLDKPLRSAQ